MMRKDVRLGFAIGGVLLAVVVAYVLVVPGGKVPEGTELAKDDQTSIETAVPENGTSLPPVAAKPTDTPPSAKAADAKPNGTDPFGEPGAPKTEVAFRDPVPPPQKGGPDVWASLLTTGKAPSMMATREVSTADAQVAGADKPNTMLVPDSSADPSLLAAQTSDVKTTKSGRKGSSTQPNSADGRQYHIVQSGESLAKIAAAKLGSESLWTEIQKANNNIDPMKVRIGMQLVIPDKSTIEVAMVDKREKDKPLTAKTPPAPIADGRSTYEVIPNDNLYRISKKLYGSGDRVQAIYELNKEMIGADPAKLKLHTVLKLPSPPAVTSAAQ